jgi:hypothetical protein
MLFFHYLREAGSSRPGTGQERLKDDIQVFPE